VRSPPPFASLSHEGPPHLPHPTSSMTMLRRAWPRETPASASLGSSFHLLRNAFEPGPFPREGGLTFFYERYTGPTKKTRIYSPPPPTPHTSGCSPCPVHFSPRSFSKQRRCSPPFFLCDHFRSRVSPQPLYSFFAFL